MNDAAPTRINALTSWRGIFILSVVLFHSGEELFMELATSGVVGFFIMSGFLMRMKHQPEPIRGARFKSFVANRALRLYSLHWFAFALLMAATFGFSTTLPYMSWGALVPNLLLVQSFVPDVNVFFSFNTPHMVFVRLVDLLPLLPLHCYMARQDKAALATAALCSASDSIFCMYVRLD